MDALDTAATLVSELIDEAGVERGRVLAAGMGLPGPIDRESGLVHSQPILPGWVALDPAAEMEERLGLPVHLDNDANVGALGESTFGVGRGTHVMAYLRLSAGIGAGPRHQRPPLPRGARHRRARSATSWSIPRARSAAAATAAASRPSSPAPRCASCCAARTAR